MELIRLTKEHMPLLWPLQVAYKEEIGEDRPGQAEYERLSAAIAGGRILFYGALDGAHLSGCCSIAPVFSTFTCETGGVFEDFYILPECRHTGLARCLLRFAREDSGVRSLTVGCADCDLPMYRALGFTVRLGTLLALEEDA